MYINSIPSAIKDVQTYLYTNDMAIMKQGTDSEEIWTTLSAELGHAKNWLTEHKLSLNTQKTKAMHFGTTNKLSQLDTQPVTLNGAEIKEVSQYKNFGQVLDFRLRFDAHVDHLVKKFWPKLCTLRRTQKYLTVHSSLYLYRSSIEPCFTFNDHICDSMTVHDQNRLQVLQNACHRTCLL